jgi:hypothetical protein
LTKGPFNALRTTPDLNNALVSYILTSYPGYSSSAGFIGPDMRINHDISLLIPEIWTRLTVYEQQPAFLIAHGYLEPLHDFVHQDKKILASRLGYRITEHFVHDFLGKIFDNPAAVFTAEILQPEIQDLDVFVDGINNIVETQKRVAQQYLDDGSIDDACPPLQALLHIMASDHYQGKDAQHPEIRDMFSSESLLASDWYRERLEVKQQRDIALWQRHVKSLQAVTERSRDLDELETMGIPPRLLEAEEKLKHVQSADYLDSLVGTIGADPLRPARSSN